MTTSKQNKLTRNQVLDEVITMLDGLTVGSASPNDTDELSRSVREVLAEGYREFIEAIKLRVKEMKE